MEELLAQVVEEVSVLAADRRRKKPRQLPRPGVSAPAQPGRPVEAAKTHGGLLTAMSSMAGRVRVDGG